MNPPCFIRSLITALPLDVCVCVFRSITRIHDNGVCLYNDANPLCYYDPTNLDSLIYFASSNLLSHCDQDLRLNRIPIHQGDAAYHRTAR